MSAITLRTMMRKEGKEEVMRAVKELFFASNTAYEREELDDVLRQVFPELFPPSTHTTWAMQIEPGCRADLSDVGVHLSLINSGLDPVLVRAHNVPRAYQPQDDLHFPPHLQPLVDDGDNE